MEDRATLLTPLPFFNQLDSAILKFAHDLIPSDTIRARWRHVHKIPFNSKVNRSNVEATPDH